MDTVRNISEEGPRRPNGASARRRTSLICAVINIVTTEGAPALTISKVTRYANCSRSLFYHYFPTLDAAVDAAIGYAVGLAIDKLEHRSEHRGPEDVPQAVRDLAVSLTSSVLDPFGALHAFLTAGSASLYRSAIHQIASGFSTCMRRTMMIEIAQRCGFYMDDLPGYAYAVISGLVFYIANDPEAGPANVEAILADALHARPAYAQGSRSNNGSGSGRLSEYGSYPSSSSFSARM